MPFRRWATVWCVCVWHWLCWFMLVHAKWILSINLLLSTNYSFTWKIRFRFHSTEHTHSRCSSALPQKRIRTINFPKIHSTKRKQPPIKPSHSTSATQSLQTEETKFNILICEFKFTFGSIRGHWTVSCVSECSSSVEGELRDATHVFCFSFQFSAQRKPILMCGSVLRRFEHRRFHIERDESDVRRQRRQKWNGKWCVIRPLSNCFEFHMSPNLLNTNRFSSLFFSSLSPLLMRLHRSI